MKSTQKMISEKKDISHTRPLFYLMSTQVYFMKVT